MKKYYKKNIISIVILLCIVLILYFTPPIMLADGWIEFGSRADSFETHMLDEYDNFYFINLRSWEKMSITRIVYDGDKNTTCELIFPGVYRVENTRKGAYVNSFEIKRGKTLWFCDYYANEM